MQSAWELMEPVGDILPPLFGHTSTIINKTKVVIFGGVDNKLTMSNSVYIYSVYNNAWTLIQSIAICY